MKKIGFVTPWYGENIPGGAEMELRGIVSHLNDAGVSLEVLTTCVKDFNSDWNVDYYGEGEDIVNGVVVRRFKVRKRDVQAFDAVNYKLMNGLTITAEEEDIYEREMVNSPNMYEYIHEHKDDYCLFVFIPYMFGTTYYGIQECYEKAVMIPCFHDESYIYMECFKREFSKVAGMIFHAQPEAQLAGRVYDLSRVDAQVLGEGVYTEYMYDAARFRDKFHIQEPFILYAGRKDVGKNIYTLINNFCEYKHRNENDIKLVLIGGGKVEVPKDMKKHIIDLGFVDQQDKYDAYAAAAILCQPSKNESFSLVIMESWICERPVLVHEQCNVTKHFAKTCNGGLYFNNYYEFEGAVNYLLEHPDVASAMGKNGKEFVLHNFAWDVIVEKYMTYFKKVAGEA